MSAPYYYDLHLHSCLSPCGDMDMSVNNIVNMALLKGLQIIALTDHNSCKNVPAILKAAEKTTLSVLPGMELSTAEDIHCVCLFGTLSDAMAFDEYVHSRLYPIKNKPEIYGEQVILNEFDEPVGTEELLLVNASAIPIAEVPQLVKRYHGLVFPAHIDKNAFSILSSLGFIPLEYAFTAVEVYRPEAFFAAERNRRIAAPYRVVTNSDAHYLWDISEAVRTLSLDSPDFAGVKKALGQ